MGANDKPWRSTAMDKPWLKIVSLMLNFDLVIKCTRHKNILGGFDEHQYF